MSRRAFLGALGVVGAGSIVPSLGAAPPARPSVLPVLRPRRLSIGDTIGLVAPANATFLAEELAVARETFEALGLRVKVGRHLLDRYGYFAGRDEDRAADVNAAFADPEIDAIFALRGGWGSARLLPRLDYELIRKHPKILMGYSDVTALLLAIHARTGLLTFHGPVGISTWTPFSIEHMAAVLFEADAPLLQNPVELRDGLVQVEDRIQTITPGRARGRLLGGNLTVLTAIIGSPYLPSFDGAILFIEDTGEQVYRIDRMLTQLALAGVLSRVAGVVFGRCTDCKPGDGYGALTLDEVLADHVKTLRVPAFRGAMIGHIDQQFTIPVGSEAEIDADRGTIRLLGAAVV
jgi:muramoyltetrapeptide carboxypeptidase